MPEQTPELLCFRPLVICVHADLRESRPQRGGFSALQTEQGDGKRCNQPSPRPVEIGEGVELLGKDVSLEAAHQGSESNESLGHLRYLSYGGLSFRLRELLLKSQGVLGPEL